VNEQGSMLPFMAALIFIGLVVVGLALDATLLAATYREAAFAADVGAEAGAAQLSTDSYGEEPLLDPQRAEVAAMSAALSARPRAGRTADASADTAGVCVSVTDHYQPRILAAIGVGPEAITVEACAEPRRG
jgi:flagellar motility protein MotE (MotC chaperone)